MTTIMSLRALPHKDTPTPEAISTTADVIELVRRSNHATAFAGWTVATIAMGVVIQADTLRSIESFSLTSILMVLLIPILAATARIGYLLVSAGRAISVVGDESEPTGAAADTDLEEVATRQAWDRLRSVIIAAQIRDTRARRALAWAYGTGAAFLTWSLAAVLLASN